MEAIRVYVTNKEKDDGRHGRRIYVATVENLILDPENPVSPTETSGVKLALTRVDPDRRERGVALIPRYARELLNVGDAVSERAYPISSDDKALVTYPLEKLPVLIAAYQISRKAYDGILRDFKSEEKKHESALRKRTEPIEAEIREAENALKGLVERKNETIRQLGEPPSLERMLEVLL